MPADATPEQVNQWSWLQRTYHTAYEAWEGMRKLTEESIEHRARSDAHWAEVWRGNKARDERLDCLQEQIDQGGKDMAAEQKRVSDQLAALDKSNAVRDVKLVIVITIAAAVVGPFLGALAQAVVHAVAR